MNVYDFDGTIFPTDCTINFCFWCLARKPLMWITFVPKAIAYVVGRALHIVPEYLMQRKFFSFLQQIDDFDVQIERYWNANEKKIAPWYLAQRRDDDLIISASPTCIIEPIAKRLGVRCVATEFDRELGVYTNNFMYAKEKAKYIFDQGFPKIEEFYSDSLSDTPLALCAERAFFVSNKARTVSDWPELDEERMAEVREMTDTGWDIHLKE